MKSSNFKMLPETLLLDEAVTKNDLLVYVGLLQFKNNKTGKAFPSIATIAKLARVSENTVRTALTHLAQLGYITVGTRYDNATKTNKSNVYTLLNVDNKEIVSVLGGEVIVEEPKQVAQPTQPKKRVIKRKQAPKQTAPSAQNAPLIQTEKSLQDHLVDLQEEEANMIENACNHFGVESIEDLSAEDMEIVEKALRPYINGEALLKFGIFFEEKLGESLSLEQLKKVHALTGGEYKNAIEGVLTMYQLIKDKHVIRNKFAYLQTVIKNGESKKVAN